LELSWGLLELNEVGSSKVSAAGGEDFEQLGA
jgi:hypothetical protein